MGALLCCFGVPDTDEHSQQAAGVHRNCICHRCVTQSLENLYNLVLQRGRVHAVPSLEQGTSPLPSASLVDDGSISRTYSAPPRPLAYDDPRCSGLHHKRVRLASSYDKASSHQHEESEPLRSCCDDADADAETKGVKGSWNESNYRGESKLFRPESSLNLSKKVTGGDAYFFHSSEDEDEDVCPTCLEEYTSENPRIILQCSHHFHLGCIYEWMERSEACPVCGKVMLFEETR